MNANLIGLGSKNPAVLQLHLGRQYLEIAVHTEILGIGASSGTRLST